MNQDQPKAMDPQRRIAVQAVALAAWAGPLAAQTPPAAQAANHIVVPPGMESIVQKFRYAPAVRAGNTLYLSGQLGRDKNLQVVEGAEAQYAQAFENLKSVLAAAGATLDNVVDMVTYHTDIRDLMRFMEVKNRYFTKATFPAWTAFGVTALAGPGLLVEIKATAVL